MDNTHEKKVVDLLNDIKVELKNISRDFEFYKLGDQLIRKDAVMSIEFKSSYKSDSGMPSYSLYLNYTGEDKNNNVTNVYSLIFEFISAKREEDITQETKLLLMYCLIEAMNDEYRDNESMIFNLDSIATRLKIIYEKALEQMLKEENPE